MLYSGEVSPTRCNNCVFYSQWLYSTCFGWDCHPKHVEKSHCELKKRNCCILLDLFHHY